MRTITTGVDRLIELVSSKKSISIKNAAKSLGVDRDIVEEWAEFLEEQKIIRVEERLSEPYLEEIKEKSRAEAPEEKHGLTQISKKFILKSKNLPKEKNVIDSYEYYLNDIPISIIIKKKKGEFVPVYEVSIFQLGKATEFVLEKIREELIKKVNLGMIDISSQGAQGLVEERLKDTIKSLVGSYFPDADDSTKGFLATYLVEKSLGLGSIELLIEDTGLEEIVINDAKNPVWVYHKKHGWLKTNIMVSNDEQTRHYANIIGRKSGKQITLLEPLLDAHMESGDRVNATLSPISGDGNTITIRKFSREPWTITSFVKSKTISIEAAALIWTAIQYEMSMLIAGGTASGKTSTLNCFASFFPPNQRIISIEDTREIKLPKFLHWVPLSTRLANSEGKGEVAMEDLLVNSLRMRPDRIIVGEIRRKKEAETLFEAIHTGHSVYATVHANNAEEVITRLTNPPIDIPKTLIPGVSLIVTQFRNRRTGMRRTSQIAEVLPDSGVNVLLEYDPKTDSLKKKGRSKSFIAGIKQFTGLSEAALNKEISEKEAVLSYLVKHDISGIEDIGRIIAEYYTDRKELIKNIRSNKPWQKWEQQA
ncbi:MAG: ATPase, T2SS/T4P/T4SS family [Candidatus Woesearchaeota archaeon]